MAGNRGVARGIDRTGRYAQTRSARGPASTWGIVMKIRSIVIGMVGCLFLPLAGANAGAVVGLGLSQAGAGASFERGAVNTAENFGRNEDQGDHGKHCENGDHGDDGKHCEKSPSKPYH